MCRNNGPVSLTKINKSATRGAMFPILLWPGSFSSPMVPARVRKRDCGTNVKPL